jgi:hypothetical protein
MNTITVGAAECPLRDANAAWIDRQFAESARSGRVPCVRVAIDTSGLNMVLQTPTCGSGGVGGRPPNVDERKVLDLWSIEGLNSPSFTPRAVADFVERVKHLIN